MKKHFLTGLVILMPIALTLMIVLFLFDLFTTPFVSLISSLMNHWESSFLFYVPLTLRLPLARILAFVFLILFIFLLGALTRWFLMNWMIHIGEKIISKIPFIKTVYKVSRDIAKALFSTDGKKIFQYSVLAPFPFSPSHALGFRAGEVSEEIQKHLQEPSIAVFVPTAPHPISGFLFFMPEKDAPQIAMNTEEAVKFLISCGVATSDATE